MTSLPQRCHSHGFTLLELVVVAGLMAGLSFFVIGTLGAARGAALQSAQATVANLLVAARTKASASGHPARVLVQCDARSGAASGRFLRHLVLQEQVGGAWQTVSDVYLPDGVYVLPGNFALPAGLLATAKTPWTRSDGADLRSTALRSANLTTEAIHGGALEQWVGLPFAAAGTTNASGDIVLAAGRVRPPGSYASGESPVELTGPEQVRGLALSAYGVATLINSRASF